MEKQVIPILMYHSIQSVPRTEVMRSLHVHPRSFALQMRILKMLGFRGCSVSEAIASFKSGIPEKLVALTFDDGYKNFLTNAAPTLKKHGFSATIYAVSDLVGTFNQWDLKNGISRNDLMDYADLRQCVSGGFEIGCHSATHVSLTSPAANLEQEIKKAKHKLEDQLDSSVDSFCYPYGHFESNVCNWVRLASFTSATTMIRSRATSSEDPIRLPRIPITWHTLPHLFVAKIATSYEDRRRHA
jgi:peptidoglycan/xylan/chitin deacetylase (PgdA/CDA1 family)